VQAIKDTFLKYWFGLSTVALVLLYFLLDRQRKTVAQLKHEAEMTLLGQELAKLKERSEQSDVEFEKSKQAYDGLLRRHPDLFKRLGVGKDTTTEGDGR
jgi:hypothetical protein